MRPGSYRVTDYLHGPATELKAQTIIEVVDPDEVQLAEEWVAAALEAEALAFGEFGGPDALLNFAKEIAAYSEAYSSPATSVATDVHEASSPDLSFVCVRSDFAHLY